MGPRVLDGQGTVGGLVGLNGGEVRTSYVSGGTVTANTTVGMLVGGNTGVVEDSYAVGGMVECRQGNPWSAGGSLVGGQGAGGSIRRSYATGTVTGICGSRGVLVGGTAAGTVQAGYYDVEASEPDRGGGEGRTTRALKAPVASAGPYSTWSAVVWHFGTSRQYPVLRAGGHRPTAQFARQGLSDDASLGALTVSGAVLSPVFAAGTTAYTAAVGHDVARVTVAATPARSVSTVGFVPAVDADPSAEGHQVDLSEGVNAVAVAVEAEDGTTTRRYAVAVTRARAPGLDLARSLGVVEGGSGTYTVALATRPTGAVTVAVAKVAGGSANVSVAPPSLTFTVSDWDGAQTVTVDAADDADTDPDAATVRHSASGGGYGAVTADLAVSVAENDAPGLVVDADPASTVIDPGPLALSEGDADAASKGYTVRLATRPAVTVTVTVASADAAAVAVDTDRYTPGDQSALVFDASTWGTARTVTARAPDDADAGAESVVLSHTAAGGAYTGVDATLTVTVADDDVLAAPANLVVGAQVQALHLAWDAVAGAGGYKVQWTAGGQGYDGSRQVLSTATTYTLVSLAAGVEYTVRVLATRSGVHDGPASAEATGTPRALPSVSIDAPRVHEGAVGAGGTLRFTVALGHASQQQVAVGYADAGTGTATSGTDYTALGAGVLTFAPGTTARTLDVAVTGDGADESDETVVVVLSSPVNAVLGTASGAGAIVDDDGTPSVSIDSPSVAEGAGEALRFTVALSHASAQSVSVRYADAGTGTATSGVDYTALGAGVLTFAAGESTRTFDVAVIDDALEEADETVVVVLSSPANAVLGTARGAGAIANDETPAMTLVLSPSTIGEGGSANVATVTVTLGRPAARATTLTVTAGPGANAMAGDYTLGAADTLTIAAGATTSTGTVTVTVAATVDDAVDAPDRHVTVWASASGARGTVVVAEATLAITDDDDAPDAVLSLSSASISENGGVATVTATLSHPSSEPTTVAVAAVAGAYSVASGAGASIVIAAGETVNASDTAVVAAVDNSTDTPDRTVTVGATLANGQGAGTVTGAALVLTDDDDAPGVTLSVAPSSIAENGGVATVVATLSHPSSEPTTVTVESVADAYSVGPDASIVIAAGETTSTDTATVSGLDNAVHAGTQRTVTVGGSAGNGQGVGTVTGATLALTDDEPKPTVALVLTPAAIDEGGTTSTVSTVTATLSGPAAGAVTLTVTAAAGANAVAADFTQTGTTLTIAANATTSTGAVTVTAVDDNASSGSKSVTVSATAASAWAADAPVAATLTIRDDESPPTATLVLTPSAVPEAGGVATVTATLNRASTAAATLTVAAAAGANAGAGDFTLGAADTLTFAAGATTSTGTVTVTAVADTTDSPDKSVTVSATVSDSRAPELRVQAPGAVTLAIADDDDAPTVVLSVSPSSIAEAGGEATVSAALSHPSSEPTTVTVSAVAGAYTVGAGATIVIAAGQTVNAADTAVITAVDNDVDAPDNAVTVTVAATARNSQGVGAVTGAALAIADDDTAAVVVSPAPSTTTRLRTTEAGGTATFTVELGSEPTGNVVLAVASGNTSEGMVSPSSLTFTDSTWNVTRTVTLTGVNDADDDGSRNYTVTLTVDRTGTVDAGYDTLGVLTVYAVNADDDGLTGPAVWKNTNFAFDVTTSSLTAAAFRQTVTVEAPSARNWNLSRIVACSWTSVQPANVLYGNPPPAGCRRINNRPEVTTVTLDSNITPTATEISNGGVVVLISQVQDDRNNAHFFYSEWVPLVAPGITVSPAGALSLTEGGSGTYNVKLAAGPSDGVKVRVASNNTDVTVNKAAGTAGSSQDLSFTASTWNTNQVITVAAAEDVDRADESATLTYSIVTADTVPDYDGVTNVTRTMNVTDNDKTPGILAGAVTGTITEAGGSATFTVALGGVAPPTAEVTVAVSSGDTTEGTVSPSSLTFTRDNWSTTQTVTVTGKDDDVDDGNVVWNVRLGPSSSGDADYNALMEDVPVTTTDDDNAPEVALALSSASISEMGGVATVSATLSHPSSAATTVTVAAVAGAYTVGPDASIVIAAGQTVNAADTVTLTAVDNDVDAPDNAVTVAATARNSQGVGAVTGAVLVLADDDDPRVTLALSPSTIGEGGSANVATVTATLDAASVAAMTVTVAATPGANAMAGDYTLGAADTLTIAAGATASTGTVTVTAVDDTTDAPDRQVTVSATAASALGATAPAGVTLTITDDDAAPGAVLSLSSASISENGGESTVGAVLSHPSSEPTTVTVAVVAGAYTVGSDASIVIAAGETVNASDTVVVAAVDNPTDAPDRTVTVGATLANGQGAGTVSGAALVLADDDDAPGVTLSVSPSSIAENGGVATVVATLSHPSSEPTTVTVAAVAGAYTVGSDATIVVAAGETTSTDTATVSGSDNAVHAGTQRTVTVGGSAANGQGVGAVTGAALVLTDDEPKPTVALVLTPAAIDESGTTSTVSTVTATLGGPAAGAVTLTVTAAAGTNAVATDFTQTGTTLTIAANATTSTGTVTVTAVDDSATSGSKSVMVSATAASAWAAGDPVAATLTIRDDESPPTATLVLTPSSVAEAGGVATVTATLNRASTAAATLTVSAAAGENAGAGDFTLGAADTLTFAAGATTSTGTVTVTAVADTTDSPGKSVAVSATVSDSRAEGLRVLAPGAVTLAIADDDDAPGVTLSVSPSSIAENAGVATVTATLSHPSSEPTTVTVAAVAGAYTAGSDAIIVIAAGQTVNAADTVTLTAVDNDVDAPDRTVTVAATARNSQGVGAVTGAVLVLADDDDPRVTLALSPSTIGEGGSANVATVTATLDAASVAATTVTVAAAPGANAMAGDYTLGAADTLTIAAGVTASTGTVTVTAVDDTTDAPDRQVTVSATAASALGATAPAGVTLTITDDDAAPGAVLSLLSASISENGGESTVGAVLSHPSSEPTTVTVAVVAGAYTVGSDASIVIAAGETVNASDTAVVVAVDNPTDAPDRTVTVGATLANGQGAGTVSGAALVLADDDDAPGVTLSVSPSSIAENGGVATVVATLSHPSSEPTTVTVAAVAGAYTVGSDATIVVAAGETTSTDTATVSGSDNAVHAGTQRTVTVGGSAANGQGVGAVTGAALALTDDEPKPTVALVLTPAVIDEGGTTSTVSTVTATLGGPAAGAVTLTVTAAAGANAVATDFTQTGTTLTIAANATTSTGTVTVTAVDDNASSGSKSVTVSATAASAWAAGDPVAAPLTIRDDESPPTATLVLTPSSVAEAGGVATVTATLNRASAAAATLTVSAAAGENTGAGDFTLGAADTLTFAAGATASTGTVTVTAVADTTDSPDKSVTVSATVSDSRAPELRVQAPSAVTLAIADDDDAPTVVLSVAPSSIAEAGGEATVSAALSHPSSEPTTVTVEAEAGAYTAGPDASIVIAAGQTVNAADTATLTAVDNDVDAADNAVTVTGSAANAQATAESETMTVTGAGLTITDDDTAALVVSPITSSTTAQLRTTEDGGTDTFTVELGSEPTGNVVLAVVSSDTAEGTVSVSSLTFTDSTWNEKQTVTLTGVDDNPDDPADGDQDYTVTLTVNTVSTADATYDALSEVKVYAVNDDNDDNDATADVNEDGAVDTADVLVMYYTYTSGRLLEADGAERLRRLVLQRLRVGDSEGATLTLPDNDTSYMTMLNNARDWQNNRSAGGDVNEDGRVDTADVLVMYYTYTSGRLLEADGAERLRRLVLQRLRVGESEGATRTLPDTDTSYMTMFNNAKALSTSPPSP